jgi:hypothetical protein
MVESGMKHNKSNQIHRQRLYMNLTITNLLNILTFLRFLCNCKFFYLFVDKMTSVENFSSISLILLNFNTKILCTKLNLVLYPCPFAYQTPQYAIMDFIYLFFLHQEFIVHLILMIFFNEVLRQIPLRKLHSAVYL